MHISVKIKNLYFILCFSTCFGPHCLHHQEIRIAAHAASVFLSNYKHSICLHVMCGYVIMYNVILLLVKICLYGTFYINPYKSIVFYFGLLCYWLICVFVGYVSFDVIILYCFVRLCVTVRYYVSSW
jgi:hypothetical protein